MTRLTAHRRPAVHALALGAVVAATALTGAVVPVAAAPVASVVGPGGSIQQALDRVAPGGTVVVRRGVYAESLTITRPVRLLAQQGAVLTPPASPPDNLCTRDPDAPPRAVPGVCIAGEVTDPDAEAPPVTDPVDDVTVRGLTVRGFGLAAIEAYGARDLLLDRVVTTADGGGGFFVAKSSRVRLDHLAVRGTGGRGLDLHEGNDHLLLRHSTITDNLGEGVFVGTGTAIRIEDNRISGNCVGIAAVDLAVPGQDGLSDVVVRHNTVVRNNRFCAGHGPAAPSESGTGIALVGTRDAVVVGNVVRGHVGADDPVTRQPAMVALGGIALLDAGPMTGGAAPTGNVVRDNVVLGNLPYDVLADGSGSDNQLVRNRCHGSTVPGACTARPNEGLR
jgi:nitrous oxidase accessory protein NosD